MMHNPSQTPLVSVIIPTYNRAHMIGDALNSVYQQSYTHIEVIVIDDGSTDNTRDIVCKHPDTRIRYIYQDNAGVSSARNRGINDSKGEFIAFLDSDDTYHPDCIAQKVQLMQSHPDCVLVGGGCTYFNDAGNCELPPTPARSIIRYEDLCIFTAFPGGTCNIFSTRKMVIKAGAFNTKLSSSEDRDFLRRLAKLGEVKSCNTFTVGIRVHTENRPNRNHAQMYADREWVSQQIDDPLLRKKSRAWNAMIMANAYWNQNKKLVALLWWVKSFLIYARAIHPDLPRTKSILRDHLFRNFLPH